MSVEIFTKKGESFLQKRDEVLLTFNPNELKAPFPKNALIELSNWCNHACVFCTNPRMARKKGSLDINLYKRIIKEAVPLGLEAIGLYTTGEPFFTKNLDEFIRFAKDAGIKYVYLTTNGALATPDRLQQCIDAGVSSIKFSVNAGSQETYKLIHGKDDFEKVLQNIRWLAHYREKHGVDLKVFASAVLTRFTEDEKFKIKDILLPYVDELLIAGVGNQAGQALEQLSLLESTMVYPKPTGNEKAQPCYMLWTRLHVTFEGYLTLCCLDYEDSLTYADLNQMSVVEAWNCALMLEMRKRHVEQKLDGTLCKNCLYGTKEKIYPISDFGYAKKDQAIEFANPTGVRSVTDRITQLAELYDAKQSDKNQNNQVLAVRPKMPDIQIS